MKGYRFQSLFVWLHTDTQLKWEEDIENILQS